MEKFVPNPWWFNLLKLVAVLMLIWSPGFIWMSIQGDIGLPFPEFRCTDGQTKWDHENNRLLYCSDNTMLTYAPGDAKFYADSTGDMNGERPIRLTITRDGTDTNADNYIIHGVYMMKAVLALYGN